MSLDNRTEYAVVCFGSDNGVLLPTEEATAVFALLAKGAYVQYGWGDSAFKFPDEPRGGREGLKLIGLDAVAVSKMMLAKD